MEAELDEITRRKALFSTVLPSVNLAGRTVILVDDGVATGATMKAAARAIEQYGVNRVVIAVPVAPAEAVADLQAEVEEVICLETMSSSGAVGNAYSDFRQLSDDDVIDCFREAAIAAR
jgi:predicted phosphoribosyltransferase